MCSLNSRVNAACPDLRYTTEIEKVMDSYDEMSGKIVGQLIKVRENKDGLFTQLLVRTVVARVRLIYVDCSQELIY